MILSRYICREIVKVQTVSLLVLMTAFLCQAIIKYMSRATAGTIPVEAVSQLIVYTLPQMLYLMLPLSLFIGVMVAIGRISSDSEMVVMRASGYSTADILRVALGLALATGILNAVNNLIFMPYAEQKHMEIAENANNNPQYLPIEGGRFVTFSGYTMYLDSVEESRDAEAGSRRQLGNCYVLRNAFGERNASILIASSGLLSYDEHNVQWLHLTDATRYEGILPDGTMRLARFDKVRVSLPGGDEIRTNANNSAGHVPTMELVGSDDPLYIMELQWRICPLLACFILTAAAVPLSLINPRQGRFARLFPAIIIYIAYFVMMLSVRNMMLVGRTGMYPGMYAVPVFYIFFVTLPLYFGSGTYRRLQARRREKDTGADSSAQRR